MGSHPFILSTEPYNRFKELVDRFGSRILNSQFTGDYYKINLVDSSGKETQVAKKRFRYLRGKSFNDINFTKEAPGR